MKFKFLRPYQVDKIRIGNLKDGGYVLEQNSLKNIDVVYSYGVGWDISFELELFKTIGKKVRLFDPTLFDADTQKLYQRKGRLLRYFVKVLIWKLYFLWIRTTGRKLLFYNEGLAVKQSGKYDSFSAHLRRFGDQNKNILLKIDIEGSEYAVLKDEQFQKDLEGVVQLAIELHDLDKQGTTLHEIVNIMKDRFSVAHVHANNYGGTFSHGLETVPLVIEVTFVNNRFLKSRILDSRTYPLRDLDYPNNPLLQDISLENFFSKA
jgi:hypothetical protein